MQKIEFGLRVKKNIFKKSSEDYPLVSIITAVKNGEKYIKKTIESVISQTYKNIEYIIIDGFSTDKTLDIIKKYEDVIDYCVSEKDNGISEAFNKGIKLSNGELIGIINSDDWYEPNTVEKVVKVYKSDKNIGIIHGDLRFFKDNVPLFVISPHNNPQKIWTDMIYNHPTCFVKKDIYIKYGMYNEKYKYAMDYELLLRFYINGVKFYYINDILANMRYEGKSDKNAIKALKETREISINYGYPAYKANFWFIYKSTKYILKKLIGKDRKVIQFLRKFSKRKKIISNK
jgi:glycosyltransferase involved in cell wall biosynthesis